MFFKNLRPRHLFQRGVRNIVLLIGLLRNDPANPSPDVVMMREE